MFFYPLFLFCFFFFVFFFESHGKQHDGRKGGQTLRKKFDANQEISETTAPNDKYENFVNAHLEAVVECMPTKPRAKPRVLWETLAVRKKRADVKTASKCNRRNPININAQKLKNIQN